MSNLWHCYTWRGSADTPRGSAEPAQNWTSPEGAVEFLRRELISHGQYSKETLQAALLDLRQGKPVVLSREIAGGKHLHLEVIPETV